MWWRWVWNWQFIIAAVLLLGLGTFLISQPLHSAQQDDAYQEKGQSVSGLVIDRQFGWLPWLAADGDGWFRPYKYTFGFNNADGADCAFTLQHWDWVMFMTTHQALEVGDDVNINILDGCDARLMNEEVTYRYWSWKGFHASAAFILAGVLLFMHTKHEKYE